MKSDGKWAVPARMEFGDPGVVRGTITISTDMPGETALTVPVYAHVVGSGEGPMPNPPPADQGEQAGGES